MSAWREIGRCGPHIECVSGECRARERRGVTHLFDLCGALGLAQLTEGIENRLPLDLPTLGLTQMRQDLPHLVVSSGGEPRDDESSPGPIVIGELCA